MDNFLKNTSNYLASFVKVCFAPTLHYELILINPPSDACAWYKCLQDDHVIPDSEYFSHYFSEEFIFCHAFFNIFSGTFRMLKKDGSYNEIQQQISVQTSTRKNMFFKKSPRCLFEYRWRPVTDEIQSCLPHRMQNATNDVFRRIAVKTREYRWRLTTKVKHSQNIHNSFEKRKSFLIRTIQLFHIVSIFSL